MNSDVDDMNKDNLSNIGDYFNIVLIGDPSVGKTSILEKYVNKSFEPNLDKTKLIEIYKKKVYYHPNIYKLKFWDITKFIGKSDISEIDMFYNCDGIIFVSSYDDLSSLENVNIWYQLLIEYIDLSTKEMVLFINKKDLGVGKILSEEQIEKKSKDLQLDYFEVSAKSGENLDKGIEYIVNKLIKRCNDNNLKMEDSSTSDSINSNNRKLKSKKSCSIF